MRERKKPKRKYNPPTVKKPIISENVDSIESMLFKWRANSRYVDYDDEEWGWKDVKMKRFFNKCLNHLNHYEGRTWAQIKEDDHCHPAPLRGIAIRAQNRIIKRHGDMDDLYQVKADGDCRLFGRKDGQYFYLMWHDRYHTVYPMGK